MSSRRTAWLAIAVGLLVGCSSMGTSAGPTTSLPPAESPGRVSDSSPISAAPEPTGVPGLAVDDQFCSAWAVYAGTLQALGIAASFGDLSSDRLANLELFSSARLVEVALAIDAAWPTELADERELVIDRRIGPYARRAQRAVAALATAGVTTDELTVLRKSWQAALQTRDPATPVLAVSPVDATLQAKVDAAAAAFDDAVTPFAEDPSLTVEGVDTPTTDAYLVAHCPDLASSGVGDAL